MFVIATHLDVDTAGYDISLNVSPIKDNSEETVMEFIHNEFPEMDKDSIEIEYNEDGTVDSAKFYEYGEVLHEYEYVEFELCWEVKLFKLDIQSFLRRKYQ